MSPIPYFGFLRENQILGNKNTEPPIPAIIPVSRTTWWEGIKIGIYPKPVKISKNISAWRAPDIRSLVDRINRQGQP